MIDLKVEDCSVLAYYRHWTKQEVIKSFKKYIKSDKSHKLHNFKYDEDNCK